MAEEVSINMEVFNSNVRGLKDSLTGLRSKISQDRTFEKTNIEPFTEDLENTLRALKLLINDYYSLLDMDIERVRETGENMRKTDDELATTSGKINGPQPLSN